MIIQWLFGIIIFIVCLFVGLGFSLQKKNLPNHSADVAIVFGTGLKWKAKARWMHAASLFHQNIVEYIIVSGGVVVESVGTTEAEWFRTELIGIGIPPDKIIVENRATNAAENTDYSLPILQEHGFQSVVLVMSNFTGIRAHLTAKRSWVGTNIEIYNSHASSPKHWNPWTWWLSKEGWRLTKYVVVRLFRYKLLQYLWQDV